MADLSPHPGQLGRTVLGSRISTFCGGYEGSNGRNGQQQWRCRSALAPGAVLPVPAMWTRAIFITWVIGPGHVQVDVAVFVARDVLASLAGLAVGHGRRGVEGSQDCGLASTYVICAAVRQNCHRSPLRKMWREILVTKHAFVWIPSGTNITHLSIQDCLGKDSLCTCYYRRCGVRTW